MVKQIVALGLVWTVAIGASNPADIQALSECTVPTAQLADTLARQTPIPDRFGRAGPPRSYHVEGARSYGHPSHKFNSISQGGAFNQRWVVRVWSDAPYETLRSAMLNKHGARRCTTETNNHGWRECTVPSRFVSGAQARLSMNEEQRVIDCEYPGLDLAARTNR